MTLGLSASGFRVALAVDIDRSCQETHAENFAHRSFLRRDITGLTAEQILEASGLQPGELDLLAAGPPCQGLSILGQRDSTDPRNDLFAAPLRLLPELRPKYVVIENVPGLVTIGKGVFRRIIGDEIARSGYRFMAAELLTAQYGVPQMRWRMVFIGARHDMPLPSFPAPTHGSFPIGRFVPNRPIAKQDLAGFLTADDAMYDLPAVDSGKQEFIYRSGPRGQYQRAMRCSLSNELYNHYATRMSALNLERIRALRPEFSFDMTLIEIVPVDGLPSVGRFGIMGIQTMDFHGSYKAAVTNLKSGLHLHREGFPEALRANPRWLSEDIEGPNISNVFKRTFYQLAFKFEAGETQQSAGCVLAIPKSVWNSWQPHLAAPELAAIDSTRSALLRPGSAMPKRFPGWIFVFEIEDVKSGRLR